MLSRMTRTDSASRMIRADAPTLYRAFVDRDALLAWLPPQGMRATFHSFDARVGGGYRMSLHYEKPPSGGGKSTADTDVVDVEFVELVPNQRVVQRITFESKDPSFADVMTMTWSLAPTEGGTEVRVVAENVPSGISKEDHDEGLRSSLDKLAKYVE